MPRHSKLNPQVQGTICDAIRAGNFLIVACGLAGIDYATMNRWMHDERPLYRSFRDAVERAEYEAEARMAALWLRAAQEPSNWRAAEAWLAKRHPERWSPPQTVKHIGGWEGEPPIRIANESAPDLGALNDEELLRLMEKLRAHESNPTP